jgi:hypothetical protein
LYLFSKSVTIGQTFGFGSVIRSGAHQKNTKIINEIIAILIKTTSIGFLTIQIGEVFVLK